MAAREPMPPKKREQLPATGAKDVAWQGRASDWDKNAYRADLLSGERERLYSVNIGSPERKDAR